MSEQHNADQQPAFRMQKIYIKDLSFENPNSPDVFLAKEQEPKLNLDLEIRHKKINDEHYEVCLCITVTFTDGNRDDQVMFVVEIEHAAVFFLKNIPEEHLERILAVDCPMLLFPFTRQVICQLTVDGGFMPFLMDPLNFPAMYEARSQEQPQQ